MGNSISLDFDGNDIIGRERRTPDGSPVPSSIGNSSAYLSPAMANGRSPRPLGPKSPQKRTRQCWICYGEEEDLEAEAEDETDNCNGNSSDANNIGIKDASLKAFKLKKFKARWVAPCACRGSTKWVHQDCLMDWIDSQVRRGNSTSSNSNSASTTTSPDQFSSTITNSPTGSAVAEGSPTGGSRFVSSGGPLVLQNVNLTCPQCHMPYKISQAYAFPRPILVAIDALARWRDRALLWSTLGIISTSLYTISFSYGIWSGWMVGGDEFLAFLRESFDPANLAATHFSRFQVALGIPLTPLFSLSTVFPGLSWTFLLVPLVTWKAKMSLFQPRGILFSLPLIWSAHEAIVSSLLPFIYRKLHQKTRNLPAPPSQQQVQDQLEPSSVTESASNEESESLTETSSFEDEYEDDLSRETVRISILSTTSALLFPTASAVVGWLLSAFVLPRSLAPKSPYLRALTGAAALYLLKDLSRLLYWYQTVRLRKYRRVLSSNEK